MSNYTVFSIFAHHNSADTAADALLRDGVTTDRISILWPDSPSTLESSKVRLKPSHGDVEGATSRGVLSGPLGILVGLSILALPGLGPMVGESTLKAGLAGVGVSSAVSNFTKSLINVGVPELEATRYEVRLQRSSLLMAVKCESPDESKRVTKLLRESGGEDICIAAQAVPASNS